MIERHVTFDVIAEKARDFETFFREEYRPAMAASPGFVKVDLLREQEDQAQYQMVIRFASAEMAASWRSSAAHQGLSPKLKALHRGSTVKVFDVIF